MENDKEIMVPHSLLEKMANYLEHITVETDRDIRNIMEIKADNGMPKLYYEIRSYLAKDWYCGKVDKNKKN